MPDTPVERSSAGPYDPGLEPRVSRLEKDVSEALLAIRGLEQAVTRVETLLVTALPHLATRADLAEIKTELAELKVDVAEGKTGVAEAKALVAEGKAQIADVKAELGGRIADVKAELGGRLSALEVKIADMPSRTYLWGILGVLLTAYAAGLAALAIVK